MQVVDTALAEAAEAGKPVQVGILGAGYSARVVARHIVGDVPGLRIAAIGNRTVAHAVEAFRFAGVEEPVVAGSRSSLRKAMAARRPVVTDDTEALCESDYLDVMVDLTGTLDHGVEMSLLALEHGKHLVSLNAELDATVGPLLGKRARAAGVVFTNVDGDEPGVAMNLLRSVRGMGLDPVVAGNVKGLYDPYRNPTTQEAFARDHGQKPRTMTHFADGTKLSMELTILANATGFQVARRGCHGPTLATVKETPDFYGDKLLDGGMIDYIVGAKPGNGVFVLATVADEAKAEYLEYFKMGPGPLYCFYTPFHLPHLEISNTIARASLLGDATVTPRGGPVCETVTTAKRDLKAGEVLDGIGGYCAYGLVENYSVSREQKLLPMGLSEGCRLRRGVKRDSALTYNDVELPRGRSIDRAREAQGAAFG